MLDERAIRQKLYDMAAVFRQEVKNKRYHQAMLLREDARIIAIKMEMEQDFKDELFGIRGKYGEIIKEGLFPEAMTQKVLYELCVKGDETPVKCRFCKSAS